MMTFLANLHRHTTACRSFAFFTLVSGPAIALFITFICMNYSGSPSAHLVSAARAVIDGAPVGKWYVPKSHNPRLPDTYRISLRSRGGR